MYTIIDIIHKRITESDVSIIGGRQSTERKNLILLLNNYLEFYNFIIIQYIGDCERTFMKKIPKTDKVRQSKTTCI